MLGGCGGRRRSADALPDGLHEIAVGSATAVVRVARSPEERAGGLMGVERLGPDEGMLFLFPEAGRASFWMKDTNIALSIAFITSDGKIAEIQDMAPGSIETHTSQAAVRMALEMPAGWFGRKGVSPGDAVRLPRALAGAPQR